MTRGETDFFLNKWISQYVTSPTENQEIKAKKPLSEARIDVVEVPGKPGCYQAVAFLKPHYQLDELTVSLSLVAQLPPALQ
jgi:type VI secretion system protein ImpC